MQERTLKIISSDKDFTSIDGFVSNILNEIDDGIIVVDREFRIMSANRGYCKQTGKEIKDIIGRHCYEVSHGSKIPCYENGEECAVMHVLKSGKAQKAVHVHLRNGNEEIYVETKAYPVKDNNNEIRFIIEIISDITDRYKLQVELEQKVKELQEFYDMAVEREVKMIELKKEIEYLRKQLNSRR